MSRSTLEIGVPAVEVDRPPIAVREATEHCAVSRMAKPWLVGHAGQVAYRALFRILLALGATSALATPVLLLAAGVHNPSDFADSLLLVPAFVIAGSIAYLHQPDRAAPRLLLVVGTLIAISHALATVPSAVGSGGGLWWLANLVSRSSFTLAFAAWGTLYAIFPEAELPARRRRIAAGVMAAAALLPVLGFFSRPAQELIYVLTGPRTRVPFWDSSLVPVDRLASVLFLAPVVGLSLLIVRARRLRQAERDRSKWVLWSASVVALALVSSPLLIRIVGAPAQSIAFVAATGTLPVALMVAMVRHRLFDVDVVLRRSLVYGALALVIVGIYAALAGALGVAAGQRFSVKIAIAVTLVAAIAFDPARRRLERLADRLFLGERMGRYELIRELGASLERTGDPQELAGQIAATVRDGFEANWAEVVLHGTEAASTPSTVSARLLHGGELVGEIHCGPKRQGDYSEADRELLAVLARQAALAIRNSRLTADLAIQVHELAASRGRIVQAEEAERRRIERDLHDGIQQELIALMAKVEVARALLEHDPVGASYILDELQHLVRQTHADLRTLAVGIHPAVLSDRGLTEAIATRSTQLPIGVEIDAGDIRGARFDPEIEGAAYFLVSEGLTNVVKHSAADQAGVRLSREGGILRVEIWDNGTGVNGHPIGSGLAGMSDRLEALGGSLRVDSKLGGGTRLIGYVPVSGPTDE